MRKFSNYAIICLLLGCLWGCSSTDPDITQTSISDENPVAGQRVLLQIYANSDNYPMQYIWTCARGTLYDASDNLIQSGDVVDKYGVFWRAPSPSEVSATETVVITCRVIDAQDNESSIQFTLTLSPRSEPERVYATGVVVKAIVKDISSKSSGIWVLLEDGNIQYLSAASRADSGWGSAYAADTGAFLVYTYQYYYYSYINYWMGTDTQLINLVGSTETTYSLPDGCDGVTSLAVFGSVLWVGTQNGLYPFSVSSKVFGDQVADVTDNVRQMYNGESLLCVATTSGISYTADASTWVKPAALQGDRVSVADAYMDSAANHYIMGLESDSANLTALTPTVEAYRLSDGTNTQHDFTDPKTDYGKSLDKDLDNLLWCGTRRLNDAGTWEARPFTTEITGIKKTVISTEGMHYFLTTDGVLWVWGKNPD